MNTIVKTDAPPTRPAKLVDDFAPPLILPGEHKLCAGCGEPAAMRGIVEMVDEMGLDRSNGRRVQDRVLHRHSRPDSMSKSSRLCTAARPASPPGSSASIRTRSSSPFRATETW